MNKASSFTIRFVFALLLVSNLDASSTAEQVPERRINPQRPLEAELLAPVDSGKLSIGSPVFVKARIDWKLDDCELHPGSVVSGRVVEVQQRSKQTKGSAITILFDSADCNGSSRPMSFRIFAIIGTISVDEGRPIADGQGLFGSISARPAAGVGGTRSAPPPPPLDLNQDMSQRRRSGKSTPPSVIEVGQVFGLEKVTLVPGNGLDKGSVIASTKSKVHMDGGTQLILMPIPVVAVAAPPPVVKSEVAKVEAHASLVGPAPDMRVIQPPPSPALPDETEVCASACAAVSPATAGELSSASSTLPIARFGYVPHTRREYQAFDYESTLTYLDSRNLLFTFDPHKLRQRFPSGIRTESMRTVRAVLLDPSTFEVRRIRDWQVQGEGQFIWRAGSGEVLVHVGHQLRLLDASLDLVRAVEIPGELAFVSISPLGDRFATGTLHERYTRELHDQLYDLLGVEPEEDLDVQVFDRSFKPLLATRQSTSAPLPILSEGGELRIHSVGHDRWRISEYLWTQQERTIATTNSSCRPVISTPMPGSLFLVGCDDRPLQNWYRMIHLDGHSIMKGRGSSQEIEQSCSSGNRTEFAIRIVRAMDSTARGDSFHKEDLHAQEISVYRFADGKRLFSTINAGVSLAEQSFALSPDGHKLAVLTDANISFYSVPPNL